MPESDAGSLAEKVAAFEAALTPVFGGAVEVHPCAPHGYRHRCEFRLWHDAGRAAYVMFERGGQRRHTVETFAPAAPAIQRLMPALLARINADDTLSHKLFRVDFLTTLAGESLVTLVYHRALDEAWHDTACTLAHDLGVFVLGRSKGQKIVIGQAHVTEVLTILGNTFQLRQMEGAFTQPNATINVEMVSWASKQAEGLGGDLLELYCGNGNFTLPLALKFTRVLATEVSKSSVAALAWNIEANGSTNVAHARLSAREVAEAMERARPFRRLAHLDLDSFRFTTVFVDPPRAGIDADTLALLSRFDNIIYISCNPVTLLDNLTTLSTTHTVEAAAAFDQFPGTPHLEAGLRLRRRP